MAISFTQCVHLEHFIWSARLIKHVSTLLCPHPLPLPLLPPPTSPALNTLRVHCVLQNQSAAVEPQQQPLPTTSQESDLQLAMALSMQTAEEDDELRKREEEELDLVLKLSMQDQ